MHVETIVYEMFQITKCTYILGTVPRSCFQKSMFALLGGRQTYFQNSTQNWLRWPKTGLTVSLVSQCWDELNFLLIAAWENRLPAVQASFGNGLVHQQLLHCTEWRRRFVMIIWSSWYDFVTHSSRNYLRLSPKGAKWSAPDVKNCRKQIFQKFRCSTPSSSIKNSEKYAWTHVV